jgi:hypothetical protein
MKLPIAFVKILLSLNGKLSVLVISAILASGLAHANLVTNPGFETFTGTFGGDGGAQLTTSSTTLTGWSITNGEIAILKTPNSYSLSASEGINFLDLAGYTNTGLPKGISQSIVGLVTGQQYTLSLDIGIRNGACVHSTIDCGGPVSVSASIGASSQSFTHNSADPGNIWGTYGFVFTATDATMLLQIKGTSLPIGYQYIGLDNVSIDAVPLPSAAWLLGSGLLGLVGIARRNKTS